MGKDCGFLLFQQLLSSFQERLSHGSGVVLGRTVSLSTLTGNEKEGNAQDEILHGSIWESIGFCYKNTK